MCLSVSVCLCPFPRQPHVHIPVDRMALVFHTERLADGDTLASKGIVGDNIIHVVKSVVRRV